MTTATFKMRRRRRTLSDLMPGNPARHTLEPYSTQTEYLKNSAIVKWPVLYGIFTSEDLKQIITIVERRITS